MPAIPKRKISETVIDFGAPLLRDLDQAQSIEIVRATFSLVITVWNAHVMAMPVWDKPDVLKQLDDVLCAPGTAPQMIAACAALTTRRQQHFASDPRAVGEWRVAFDNQGRARLHCDARVPPSLMPRRG
ncbi:MAG: hypothetical protein ACXWCP_31705 [Burkholderiales bacterium]